MRLPETIVRFLDEHHADGVTEQDCRACSSPCCSTGGFAILENVIAIFARYQNGELRRSDHDYAPDLNFADFVFRYFDVYKKSVTANGAEVILMLFHMKSLSSDGNPISIPGGDDYWTVRKELFELNPWLNRGCIFLSRRVGNWPDDDGDTGRHCILHTSKNKVEITSKPIDCLYFTCDSPRNGRVPSPLKSAQWFELLAINFPDSLPRFEAMITE
jgi:hypothetical protein